MGIAYFKQNQWEMAEKEWKRALELSPDFSEARSNPVIVRNKRSCQFMAPRSMKN
ncbi:MAG: tetratricopeptide repeat protein [bacterium]